MYLCVRIVTLRLSIRRRSKQILRQLICVAATGRPELVLFFVFKTSAGTPDEVDHGDCRHVCDEASHHEDLEEGDHVHEVQYWVVRIVWSCFPFPLCNVFVFMLFGLYGVIVLLVGLYHLVLVHVVSPFCGRSDVIPLVIGCSVKFFHVGLHVSFVHAQLILLVSR